MIVGCDNLLDNNAGPPPTAHHPQFRAAEIFPGHPDLIEL